MNMIFAAGDIRVLSYVVRCAPLSAARMQHGMDLAVENNQIAMLQFLEGQGMPLLSEYINQAFSYGYMAMTRYLHSQGLGVDLNCVCFHKKAYHDIAEQDFMQYLQSIRVDAARVHGLLLLGDDFKLCRTFLSATLRTSPDIPELLTRVIKADRSDLAHDILRNGKVNLEECMIKAIQRRETVVVAFICNETGFKPDLPTEIFLRAYHNFHWDIMKRLISAFDPKLELEIHNLAWYNMAMMSIDDMLKFFCTHLAKPEPDFNYQQLAFLPHENLTFLASINWITKQVLRDLWQYATQHHNGRLLKFCVEQTERNLIPKK